MVDLDCSDVELTTVGFYCPVRHAQSTANALRYAMRYRMAHMHYLSHGDDAIERLMFGLRPRASDKRTKNQTVRLSEEELAEVQRMAHLLSEQSGVRYTVGDVIREGLRLLSERLKGAKQNSRASSL